jgi:thiol-disulfide isomerase/thioredoxin
MEIELVAKLIFRIQKILVFLPVAVLSQSTATIQFKINSPCYKFSIARVSNIYDDNRFTTYKKHYPQNGFFIVKTTEKHPTPYIFTCEEENHSIKGSGIFTVNSGDKLIFEMDSISDRKQYLPNTKTHCKSFTDQKVFYEEFPNKIDLYSPVDSIYKAESLNFLPNFEKYAKKHHDSYMLFWNLKNFYDEHSWITGNNEIYMKAFDNLSAEIKNSMYGRYFVQKILKSTKIEEGLSFPKINLHDKKEFKLGKKYTLVDFWATYCGSCLDSFLVYKDLYKRYKDNGFEIVAISGDRKKDIAKWKNMIQKRQLAWQNYIDIAGKEREKYNINPYPYTVLLDSNGMILKKNISPAELEIFLKENLK